MPLHQSFGSIGQKLVSKWTLNNRNGVSVDITNYGGIVTSLRTPDIKGKIDDVVLGCDTLEDYRKDSPHFGCITGRFANRIAKGTFHLNGVKYNIPINNGPNSLHGGLQAFDKKVWDTVVLEDLPDGEGLEMKYISEHLEEGFPGELSVIVKYILTSQNELKILYEAESDRDTVLNLTNHSYFNLAGQGQILDHIVQIFAETFIPTDSENIPTGAISLVEGTPFDFRKPFPVGVRIDADHDQIKYGAGYDHNYILNKKLGFDDVPQLAAIVQEPKSSRWMKVLTTEPGVQLYTGNWLGQVKGKNGVVYPRRGGLCLETQHYPDAVNHPEWPSVVLKRGQTYRSTTIYQFGAGSL